MLATIPTYQAPGPQLPSYNASSLMSVLQLISVYACNPYVLADLVKKNEQCEKERLHLEQQQTPTYSLQGRYHGQGRPNLQHYNQMQLLEILKSRYLKQAGLDAAKQGNITDLNIFLKAGLDPNTADEDGATLLHHAGVGRHVNAVSLLLESGCNPSPVASGWNDQTPLNNAVHRGFTQIITMLINNGANVNSQTKSGNSPLHSAAMNGFLEILQYLVSKGADTELKNSDGKTALDLAQEGGFQEIVNWLATRGCHYMALKTISSETMLKDFPVTGNMSNGANATAALTQFLMLQLLQQLQTNTTFRLDEGLDHTQCMPEYLEELHQKEQQCRSKYYECLLAILPSCLRKPVTENKLLRVLKSRYFNAAGFEAAKSGDAAEMSILLESGLLTNITDTDGATMLHHAARGGHLPVVLLLLKSGANPSPVASGWNGQTPLNNAAYRGYLHIIKALVEYKAHLDAQTKSGNTPLHDAAFNGHLQSFKYLVMKGANLSLTNEDGKTPRDVAIERGNWNISRWLDILCPNGIATCVINFNSSF